MPPKESVSNTEFKLDFRWEGVNISLSVKQDVTQLKLVDIAVTLNVTTDEKNLQVTLNDLSLHQNQSELILKMNDSLDGLDQLISFKQFSDLESKSIDVTVANLLAITEFNHFNQLVGSIQKVIKILNLKNKQQQNV